MLGGFLLGKRIMLLAAVASVLVFGATGAGAATTFTDPQGDAPGGVADITQVVVSNDYDGNVTFAITMPNRTSLTGDDIVLILLDTDKNVSTGTNGVEFAIGVASGGPVLLRATGTEYEPVNATTLTTADGNKTVRINRSELGGGAGFVFYLYSTRAANLDVGDDAPDGTAAWLYDLNLTPVLESILARFSPAKPKAGKVFRVAGTSVRLDDGTDVKPDSIRCVARLKGKRLAGNCSWRLARTAKGKQLVVTITATYKGVTETFQAYRFRVG
jgi:hypothetical protein